jgi:UDP-hydrolysing UDP-N-acetyl-D-glucosamine 2-epimerase
MSKRLLTCISTRAQYGRLKPVLQELASQSQFDLSVIVSGGATVHDFGQLKPMLEDDGVPVTDELENLIDGGTTTAQAKTTGLQLIEYATTMSTENPDAVITTGDRYETMATTLAASYSNVPVVHFEGGEITGSIDEKVRHATTKMADYHFVSTARSEQIVSALGENSDRVFNTGCPSIDIARRIDRTANPVYDPEPKYGGVGAAINPADQYLIVQYHPLPTEYKSNRKKTETVIDAIHELGIPTYWFWPNMDAGTGQVSAAIRDYRENRSPDHVRFFINMDPEDYLTLIRNAACVVGNSSVGIRECSYFGTPTVNIGERQQFRERGPNVIDVSNETDQITEAVETQLAHGGYEQSNLYGDGESTDRIVSLLGDIEFELKESMDPYRLDIDTMTKQDRII